MIWAARFVGVLVAFAAFLVLRSAAQIVDEGPDSREDHPMAAHVGAVAIGAVWGTAMVLVAWALLT